MAQTLDNLLQTWNNVATTFTGIRYDVQDTASAAGSLLMDLRTSNVSRFSVSKTGGIVGPTGATFTISSANGQNLVLAAPAGSVNSSGGLSLTGGNILGRNAGFSIYCPAAGQIGFGSTSDNFGTNDTILVRDAADTLAQRRTTNAQTFRIYNTFTDASNYERGKIEWASNVLRIGTEKLGSGTARALEFQTDGTTRLTIGTGTITFVISTVFNSSVQWGAGAGGGDTNYVYSKNLALTNGTTAFTTDAILTRDAAQTLAQRNGTNAQETRIYGSFTDATNFQRLSVKTLRESSGALSGGSYVTTIAIPAYAHLVGVTTRVTTEITGATTYDVGDGSDVDLWGAAIAVAAGSQSRTADFTAVAAVGPAAASRTVTLTANGSNFTGGVVEICLHYLTTEAD
jgi:hypothetical protein